MNNNFVIIGIAGSGKTNTLLNMIKYYKIESYSHIYIINVKDDVLYEYLAKNYMDKVSLIKNIDDVPEPKDLDLHNGTPLVVFDDIGSSFSTRQKAINYYENNTGCCCVYMTYNYKLIPSNIIKNTRYFLLLKVIRRAETIKFVLSNCNVEIDLNSIVSIYEDIIDNFNNVDNLNFLKIDCQAEKIYKVASRNFTDYYDLN